MSATRSDRNLARDVQRALCENPRTVPELVKAFAGRYSSELLAARLRGWSEDGRCVGTIVRWTEAQPVVRYRLTGLGGALDAMEAADAA